EENWPVKDSRIAHLNGNPFLTSALAIDQFLLAPLDRRLAEFRRQLQTICPWVKFENNTSTTLAPASGPKYDSTPLTAAKACDDQDDSTPGTCSPVEKVQSMAELPEPSMILSKAEDRRKQREAEEARASQEREKGERCEEARRALDDAVRRYIVERNRDYPF